MISNSFIRRVGVISVFVIFLISLSAHFYAIDSPLIYLKKIYISTLDPGLTSDIYSSEMISNIYEGLVRYKKGLYGVEPALAVSWRTENEGKKWIFNLRKGVRFHNGEVFNSIAVEVNFKTRMLGKGKYRNWSRVNSHIENVRRLGEYTIEITLNKPFVPFLSSLASPKQMIVAPSSYTSGKFVPSGTGPFKFSEGVQNKYLTLIRNEKYWGGKVRIPKIVIKVIDNVAWRIIQLKSGKASMLMVSSSKEHEELRGRRDLKMIFAPSISVQYLVFNTQKGIFKNRNIRIAFAHMINKVPMIERIFQNSASNATTPVPSNIFGFNPEIKDLSFDISKSRYLLKQGGVKEGTSVSLYYSTSSNPLEEIAGVIKKFANDAGIHISKVPLQFSDLRKAVKGKRHDIALLGWSADFPDPDVFLFDTFAYRDSEFNRSGYSDPELTRILIKARKTFDVSKREKMYFRAQEIIAKDCPWIPLYNINDILVYNKKIKGLYINQLSHVIFRDAYVEEN